MKYCASKERNQGMLNDLFMNACKDYAYLINRNYPERGTLKLVGDRYRLTRDQRTILYRGISSAEKSALPKVNRPSQVDVFLDSPVSHSEKYARLITDIFLQFNLAANCRVIRSADYGLKHLPFDVMATSDSVIIENAEAGVVDLPRIILEKQYNAVPVKIADLLLFPGSGLRSRSFNNFKAKL